VSKRFDQINNLFTKSYISGLDNLFNILGLEGVRRQSVGRYACQCVKDSEAEGVGILLFAFLLTRKGTSFYHYLYLLSQGAIGFFGCAQEVSTVDSRLRVGSVPNTKKLS
jgi:hypothetical protein